MAGHWDPSLSRGSLTGFCGRQWQGRDKGLGGGWAMTQEHRERCENTVCECGCGEGGAKQSSGLTLGWVAEGRSGALTESYFSQRAGVEIFPKQRYRGGVSLKALTLLMC